jgi:glycosyltransferase involved in cell wall biosynthesis
MVPEKRPDLLIDAFGAVAGERPDWDLVMVGGGPLRESLELRIPPDLRRRFVWTGPLDDQPAVSALYRSADVLVLPSDYEPWALVVNEATAAGLAIVASHVVGAAAELVRDGVNGRIFPAGDLAALTDALRDVTAPGRVDAMRAESAEALADWRRRGDPVEGLRAALTYCKILPVRPTRA